MESRNYGANAEINAAIDNLNPDIKVLLSVISEAVSNAALGPKYDNEYDYDEEGEKIWGGRLFYQFTAQMPKKYHDTFKFLVNDNAASYTGTYTKAPSQGLGKDISPKILYLSAKAQHKDFVQHIKDFIKYCKAANLIYPIWEEHEITINKLLLGKYDSAESTPEFTLQEKITIANEIKRIKENLGFYPNEKDNFDAKDISTYWQALKETESLLALFSTNPDLLSLKARILIQIQQPDESHLIAEAVYASNSNNDDIVTTYIMALNKLKKEQDALKIALQFNSYSDTKNPLFYFHHADTLRKLGKYEDAVCALEKAIKLDPNYLKCYASLAAIYRYMRLFGKSETTLRTALEKYPDNEHIKWELVAVLQDQLMHDESTKLALEICKNSPTDNTLAKTFAKSYELLENGKFDEAHELLKELSDQRKNNPLFENTHISITYGALANLYENTWGRDAQKARYLDYAIECREISLSHNPDNIDSLESLALLKFIKKSYSEAKELIYKTADLVERNPDDYRQPEDIFSKLISGLDIGGILDKKGKLMLISWYNEKYINTPFGYLLLASEAYLDGDHTEAMSNLEDISKWLKNKDKEHIDMLDLIYFKSISNFLIAAILENNGYKNYIRALEKIYELCCCTRAKELNHQYWTEIIRGQADMYRELGIKNKNETFLLKAVDIYSVLLDQKTRHKNPQNWSETNAGLSDVYFMLWRVSQDQSYLERSIACLTDVLSETSEQENFERWSHINKLISEKYHWLLESSWTVENLKESAKYLKNAYKHLDPKEDMNLFLDKSFELAHQYLSIGLEIGNKEEHLDRSINIFTHRHSLLNENENKEYWIESHFNLAMAKEKLYYEINNQKLLNEAIEHYVLVTENIPNCFLAQSLENLANIYHWNGKNQQDENIMLNSVSAYKKLLELEPEKPEDRAGFLMSIGYTYSGLGHLTKKVKYHENEIEYYEEALNIYSNHVKDYYLCRHYYGIALINIFKKTKNPSTDVLDQAIVFFDEVSANVKLEDDAKFLAESLEFRGEAKYLLYKANGDKNLLIDSLADLKKSLSVYNKNEHPDEYDRVQNAIQEASDEMVEAAH